MVDNRKGFQVFAQVVMILLTLFCLLPFLLLISSSFTSESALLKYGYSFIPREFSTDAYVYMANKAGKIAHGYLVTIVVTVIGTTLSICLTSLLAYGLSIPNLPGRKFFSFYVFFTMLFNGGLVPQYIMWTQIFHIRDSYLALILPNILMNAFYIIMMRTYYTSNIPPELQEAARIDGMGEFKIFWYIVIPLAKPMVATLVLMVGLAYWNDWMNGFYYLSDTSMYSIQNILNSMLKDVQFISQGVGGVSGDMVMTMPSTSIRMAIAVVGIVPIMVIYPFVQKYLVKGITVGAVKG